jgi:acyl-CoA synthetase (AMP-forming)/AMP-acid ligase II
MASTGEVITHRELDRRSQRLASLLWDRGLRPGDSIAALLQNEPHFFDVCWAALRSGLRLTPINWHLKAEEVSYIVGDCGASAFVTTNQLAEVASDLAARLEQVPIKLMVGGEIDGFDRYETALAGVPDHQLDEVEGSWMLYSSGTTGRPKGVKRPVTSAPFGQSLPPLAQRLQGRYGIGADTVYLCPAPLYHAAPLGWSAGVQRLGGAVVVLERFDPVEALQAIERYRVTHAQFVPTHFIRLLKLDPETRAASDLSSLQMAVHAAAPCPIEAKERMMAWWGPIIHEYYAGSEGNGSCVIGPEEWLAHKGSVGRPASGVLHILDEAGEEQPAGEPGQIWFETGLVFEYHNDPGKTKAAFNERGWSTLGDIGHVDGEGYLYLTDRASNMIISGGVNIYPQEIEDALAVHPLVEDVAVIGVPDPDMGEQVKAVVRPAAGAGDAAAVEQELIAYCRERFAAYKCPRSVDLVDELPRLPTGKLLKRELRRRY